MLGASRSLVCLGMLKFQVRHLKKGYDYDYIIGILIYFGRGESKERSLWSGVSQGRWWIINHVNAFKDNDLIGTA